MAKVTGISIRINESEYTVSPNAAVHEDTYLVLPLRAFVGAEYFGATRNMVVTPMFFEGSDIRRVLDVG